MKYLLFLLFVMSTATCYSQNYNAQAFNTNGDVQEKLFPENSNGETVFTDIVKVEGEASQILSAVKDYIEEQKGKREMNINYNVETSRQIICEIQIPLDKQNWTVELWGSPIVSGLRDASRLTFRCTVDVLNNKFRYKLDNFWMENRRIKGEAKDNGSPNIIFYQRYNSLKKERDAYASSHNTKKRSVREELYDYDSQMEYERIQYANAYTATENFINGLKRVKIRDDNADFDTEPAEILSSPKQETLDLSRYHGNLLAKGNNVYLANEGLEPYEQVGVAELYKQIKVDGYWNIVPTRGMAHFVIEYHMSTEGRDHAYVIITDRDRKSVLDHFSGSRTGSGESLSDNRESALNIYLNGIVPLLEKLQRGKAKELNIFNR